MWLHKKQIPYKIPPLALRVYKYFLFRLKWYTATTSVVEIMRSLLAQVSDATTRGRVAALNSFYCTRACWCVCDMSARRERLNYVRGMRRGDAPQVVSFFLSKALLMSERASGPDSIGVKNAAKWSNYVRKSDAVDRNRVERRWHSRRGCCGCDETWADWPCRVLRLGAIARSGDLRHRMRCYLCGQITSHVWNWRLGQPLIQSRSASAHP